MHTSKRIGRAARERVRKAQEEIRYALQKAAEGNPLAAEREQERLVARLEAAALLPKEDAEAVARKIRAASDKAWSVWSPEYRSKLLQVYGSVDFVPVAFLERGLRAARPVARVTMLNGVWVATGVMISDRLFLTNNHSIRSSEDAAAMCAEFHHQKDLDNRPLATTRFAFAPSDFFVMDKQTDLDYTLLAVGPKLSGPDELSDFGWCPLSGDADKHALGEVANIVQHPDGRHKEVVVRENRLVHRLKRVLHYVADTDTGSSGSPVFNNEWRMIALHHWGEPWLEETDEEGRPLPKEVNEGIRASAIVAELQDRMSALPPDQRDLLQRALVLGGNAV